MSLIFFIVAGAILIVVATLGLSFYSFFIGAPYVWTPKKALREIFAIAKIKPGDKFYDLGAGDGKTLIVTQKEFGAQALGFELSPIMYAVAKLNLFFSGDKKSKLYFRNFYKQNLSDADVIFCFLTIAAMAKLKPKLENELRPRTRVISYYFSIHGWTPKEIVTGKYPGKVFLYEI